ncbi:MAG: deoxyribodipyrimidine photo-lyase [Acetobacteraceae bacterium]|nr:deoxyribodipyrimidine photo-lyase [Acetobacteraceae bacterium]
MTVTATTHPRADAPLTAEPPLHPTVVLLNLIAALLAPMFLCVCGGDLSLARAAAIETINAYRVRGDPSLLAVAPIVAFGLAALGSLSLSMTDDLTLSMTLRLRGNANALDRSAERNRRALGKPPGDTAVPPADLAAFMDQDDLEREAAVVADVAAMRQVATKADARARSSDNPAFHRPTPAPNAVPVAVAPIAASIAVFVIVPPNTITPTAIPPTAIPPTAVPASTLPMPLAPVTPVPEGPDRPHISGMTTEAPVILWFRDDLRLADHAALRAAIDTGRPVLPVFILDAAAPGRWKPGGAARWWLHHSLASLRRSLSEHGADLVLRRGDSVALIADLAARSGATEVFTGGSSDPTARRLDHEAAAALDGNLHRMRTTTLFHPNAVRTKTGGAYSVYTPFANACLALGGPQPPTPAPTTIRAATALPSDRLEDWDLLPRRPDWAGGLRDTWTPGEAGAMERARAFLTRDLANYAAARDQPALDGTSMLSPHLRFGEISAVQLWHMVHRAAAGRAREKFIRELLWREFCANLLWHNPALPEVPLKPEFGNMPWRDDQPGLAAWQQGRTGVPIVDAGMRQLWRTGWMHNRVRMIVASFLIKHLLLPWQDGEAWFWDTLVDADLASNAANWQWVAGCGADAAPYFRIFNPVLQGRKFDADGDYVRHFVPELARLDSRHIHAPWQAPQDALVRAGVTLGETYPEPIVDLGAGRARALDAYARIRDQA